MSNQIDQRILRACLTDRNNFERVINAGITSGHFESKQHKEIFAFMSTALERDRYLTPELFPIEHMVLALEIMQTPWVQNLDVAIDEIKYRAWYSGLFSKTKDFLKSLDQEIGKQEARNRFASLASFVEADDEISSEKIGSQVFDKTVNAIEETYLAKKSGQVLGIPTGLATLDRCLSGGFRSCELATIGALTGKGKTHIGVSIAMNALRSGRRVCLVTIEMTDVAIMRRMIANESGVNSKILSAGTFEDAQLEMQMDSIVKASATFSKDNLIIADETNGSFEKLELLMRRLGRQKKIDLLVVDYIQQFYFDKPHANRVSELNLITSKVKHLTKQYGFATVMLAQLNREAQRDKERGKNHNSHQFEQSHSIAKDSDIILILDEDNVGGQEFLYLAKNRNGEDGLRLPVNLDRRTSRLSEAK